MVVAYSVFEVSLIGGFAYSAVLKLNQYGCDLGVVLAGSVHHRPDLGPRVLRRAHLGPGARYRADLRDRGSARLRPGSSSARRQQHPARRDQPGQRLQGPRRESAVAGLAVGAAGIGIFFAFWSWVGFEMAPNYGEESKDPKKTVPRAMYISVIGLGIFYTITSWAAISGDARPTPRRVHRAEPLRRDLFFVPPSSSATSSSKDAHQLLIITGSFACGMAFHNTTARYMYSLGREGALPRRSAHAPELPQPAHRVDHAVGDRAAAVVLLFVARRAPAGSRRVLGRLPAGVRPDGGDGRRLDPGHPGARLDRDP